MVSKVTALGAVGAGVGALQTPLVREFVDRKYPTTNIPSLGGFGYVSSLAGIIGGVTGLGIGAVGLSKKDGRQRLADTYVEPAIDYGITALLTGIFSGLYPAVTEADCIAKGGYFYDGVCHKTPASTLSMQPGVQTATSYVYKAPAIASQAYIPPANTQGVDMNVLKQMSSEVNRLSLAVQSLSQENAALRSQAMAPAIEVAQPGLVRNKQERFGFMTGLETSQPTKTTERIRKKFDFMG